MSDITILTEIIKKRRAIFPAVYSGEKIPKDKIDQLLENANWAPSHKKTEPWRFKVVSGKGLVRLGNFLADNYKKKASHFSQIKYEKNKSKMLMCSHVIVICMQRHENVVPEWEELAAVATAVQNLWLSATSMGLAGYWSTPSAIEDMHEFTDLKDGETCVGLFYLGVAKADFEPAAAHRGPVEDKVDWIES